MIGLSERIKQILNATGAQVWREYPQSWTQLPAVTWRESGNRELAQADGCEHLAELEYAIDVWSGSAEKNAELAEKIDLTPANLSILKNNKAKAVRFTTLNAICKALDCQPGDLLEWVDTPEENE